MSFNNGFQKNYILLVSISTVFPGEQPALTFDEQKLDLSK